MINQAHTMKLPGALPGRVSCSGGVSAVISSIVPESVLIIAVSIGVMLLLSTLFWMILKGALLVAAILFIASKMVPRCSRWRVFLRKQGTARSPLLGAFERPALGLPLAVAAFSAFFAFAPYGTAMLGLGVCFGMFLGARIVSFTNLPGDQQGIDGKRPSQ